MNFELTEPVKRPLEELIIPGEREAVEKFLNGSHRESFEYGDATIVIEEDSRREEFGIKTRVPVVRVLNEGKEILSASVQDIHTHIAQQITDVLRGSGKKGYGGIARDIVESISGIAPFETARLHYLIIFLIKRGYVPVGMINGKGWLAHSLLYAQNLPLDLHLEAADLSNIIKYLRETYLNYKEIQICSDTERRERAEAQIRKINFRHHIRLQYNPEIAQEVYQVLQGDALNFYEKIDKITESILQMAYKKNSKS